MNQEQLERRNKIISQFYNLPLERKMQVINGLIEWIEKTKAEGNKDLQ